MGDKKISAPFQVKGGKEKGGKEYGRWKNPKEIKEEIAGS